MVFLSLLPPSLNGGLLNYWLSWANRTVYYLRRSNYSAVEVLENREWIELKRIERIITWEIRTIYYLRNSNYLLLANFELFIAWEIRTIYCLRNSNYLLLEKFELFITWEIRTNYSEVENLEGWEWIELKRIELFILTIYCLRRLELFMHSVAKGAVRWALCGWKVRWQNHTG